MVAESLKVDLERLTQYMFVHIMGVQPCGMWDLIHRRQSSSFPLFLSKPGLSV